VVFSLVDRFGRKIPRYYSNNSEKARKCVIG
jgi:hypothetical protein